MNEAGKGERRKEKRKEKRREEKRRGLYSYL
jgi:hypothetical protein